MRLVAAKAGSGVTVAGVKEVAGRGGSGSRECGGKKGQGGESGKGEGGGDGGGGGRGCAVRRVVASRAAEVMVVEQKTRAVMDKALRGMREVLQVAVMMVAFALAREVAGGAAMGAAVKVVATNMVSKKAEARAVAEKAAHATV